MLAHTWLVSVVLLPTPWSPADSVFRSPAAGIRPFDIRMRRDVDERIPDDGIKVVAAP
jgi:hypothetical protein